MRSLILFNYDWDCAAFSALSGAYPHDSAGFDLFSFPSNVRLAGFDFGRFTDKLAARAEKRGWRAALSNHEQFGALAAALLCERMSWPGTPVNAVLACQHKFLARQLMAQACPDANVAFQPLEAQYGGAIPGGLEYPLFIKPVKAAFSVLARRMASHAELHAHTRFGPWEQWIIRRLVEPFERILQQRLPQAGSAHRLLIEECLHAPQYNFDGYVFKNRLHPIGFTDALMYPGTHAFMRFQTPSCLPEKGRARALDAAQRFLEAAGFSHGLFNMEFVYDEEHDRLAIIEFNSRFASQFGDLYLRVGGINAHAIALALANGKDPAALPKAAPSAAVAASFVYRAFPGDTMPVMPGRRRIAAFEARFPEALLFHFAKGRSHIARDFKWLGSYRYGIMHLAAASTQELHEKHEEASALLGWAALGRQLEAPPSRALTGTLRA